MAASQLSPTRKLLFGLIVAGVMLLVGAVVLEVGLRVAGVGHSSRLVRETKSAEGDNILRENRWATAPFFGEARVRRPWPLRLPAEKGERTYRIFVLGSSAAMGDPEPSFSLARMLQRMLASAYPEVEFEVVNAAVTAINSHVLRGIAEDCAELEPDLFVVYEGNNEVIGPFGPAGVFSAFRQNDLMVILSRELQRSRTGQWLSGLTAGGSDATHEDESWRGMEMFLRQQIPANDPRLDVVARHFRANLTAVTDAAADADATTLLCTVLTNQRDFAPFLSTHRPDLTEAEQELWQQHFAAGDAAMLTNDLRAADRHYAAAWAIDDQHAELAFRLGRLALQARNRDAAVEFLGRAQDLDTLRFRTDSRLNQVVREVAAGIKRGGLVDLATEVAQASPLGIPGDDLLYEHVHLNFHGTYLAARALFPRISRDLVDRGRVIRYVGEPISEREMRQVLGYNVHEQTMIALELVQRFERPPFTEQSDNAQRLFSWSERAERGQEVLARPQVLAALKAGAAQALQRFPDDWVLRRNTGAMLVARGDAESALPLLETVDAFIDDDVDTLMALGLAYRAVGDGEEAKATFARVRGLEPNYPGIPEHPALPELEGEEL